MITNKVFRLIFTEIISVKCPEYPRQNHRRNLPHLIMLFVSEIYEPIIYIRVLHLVQIMKLKLGANEIRYYNSTNYSLTDQPNYLKKRWLTISGN